MIEHSRSTISSTMLTSTRKSNDPYKTMIAPEPGWNAVVARKRAARQAALPAKWLIPEDDLPSDQHLDVTSLCAERRGWLSIEEVDITSKTVVELCKAIRTRRLTSLAVVSAFAHQATIAQQLTKW
jgi:amidase